jgi:uncharacterized phage protein (TIGR01671 family)
MREIKFRAWDIKNKQFIIPEGMLIFNIEVKDYKHTLCIINNLQGTLIWNQFTGLYDKNGKEIYESDYLGGIFEGYIQYCETCKSLQLFFNGYGCAACSGDVQWGELVSNPEQLEVIGNVFENPELIT